MLPEIKILSVFLLFVLLRFTTRKTATSLLISVFCALLLSNEGSFPKSFERLSVLLVSNLELTNLFKTPLKVWNPYICLFMLIVVIFAGLLEQVGAIDCLIHSLKKRITSKKQAQFLLVKSGFITSFDDFFSAWFLGTFSKKIGEKHRLSSAKLAFIVANLTSFLVLFNPLSSWFAAFSSFYHESGIQAKFEIAGVVKSNAIFAYCKTLIFMVFPIYGLLTLFFLIYKNISFGAIGKYELVAEQKGFTHQDSFDLQAKAETKNEASPKINATIMDFYVPFICFFSFVLLGVLFSTDRVFNAQQNYYESFLPSSPFCIASGALLALLGTLIFYFFRRMLSISVFVSVAKKSVKIVAPSIFLLILSWVFGDVLVDELGLRKFIYSHADNALLLNFYPFVFCLFGLVLSFFIGSVWACVAILIPVLLGCLEINPSYFIDNRPDILFWCCMGALFSGSVAGDVLSPFSDTNILVASALGMSSLQLAILKLGYMLPVLFATIIFYLIVAFYFPLMNMWCFFGTLGVILFLLFGYFLLMNNFRRPKMSNVLN